MAKLKTPEEVIEVIKTFTTTQQIQIQKAIAEELAHKQKAAEEELRLLNGGKING